MPEVDSDKRRYKIDVGHEHGVKPGNIVGAIANEAGLAGEHIGHISIRESFSLVDLPAGMPRDVFMDLKKVRVCGRPMKISLDGKSDKPSGKKFFEKPSGKKVSDKPSGKKFSDKPKKKTPSSKPHNRKQKGKG
jgi:ATP-dependent RNA helicase DeaD